MPEFDVCIVGSGAGAGPVAFELAQAGYTVRVLEKGPWLSEQDFFKDELACCRRDVYTPKLTDEQHVIEEPEGDGWTAGTSQETGWNFWNGNLVGGSSNLMSGFFHRLKPKDFRLLSEFGPIEGANIVDWPIGYEDLEPYYTRVEQVVGISGRVVPYPHAEPRSTTDFPFPPTAENRVSGWIDQAADELGWHSMPVPRAILPHAALGRQGCQYSGYCGSYGCASGAKGSARAALLDAALATGRCDIRPHSKVYRLVSDARGQISAVAYYDREGESRRVTARLYVVACQAIETARLLLSSTGPEHPQGLGNRYGQVGRNLIFSAGGQGRGYFEFDKLAPEQVDELRRMGPFVNRALMDWYYIDEPELGRMKGGLIDFLFQHPAVMGRADALKWDAEGRLVWGKPLKRRLESWFRSDRRLNFEVFNDWLPTDDCLVSLATQTRDRWSSPVAKLRIGYHPHDLKVAAFLAKKGEILLRQMGASYIQSSVSGAPPPNLVAGGCRFGADPKHSVLDADCRMHGVDNLFVSDGSFMPTGGSIPYTWTIYANAFRVADRIRQQLG